MFLIVFFILTPFLRVRFNFLAAEDDRAVCIMICLFLSIFWLPVLGLVIAYILIVIPGSFFYKLSEKAWQPKPPVPTKINEVKSSYRHIELEDDDDTYDPSREV